MFGLDGDEGIFEFGMVFVQLIKLLELVLIVINKVRDLGLIQCNSFRIEFKVMLDNLFESFELGLDVKLMGRSGRGGGDEISVGELMEEFSDGL